LNLRPPFIGSSIVPIVADGNAAERTRAVYPVMLAPVKPLGAVTWILNKFGLAPDASVDLNLLMLKKSFAIF
jgi:hypothetical protein